MADGAAGEAARHQLVAPGDDMRARYGAEFLGARDAGEAHEVAHRIFVGAPGLRAGEVGEPFDLGRHVSEAMILGRRQQPTNWRGLGEVLRPRGDGYGGGWQMAHAPRMLL